MSEAFDEHYWQEHYRAHGGAGGGEAPPNPHLVAAAEQLAPGRALDAGCGHGAEAGWLAAAGWEVTAVDISAAALEEARERTRDGGAEIADRITWVRADLTEWTPAADAFDLVCTHYVHPAEGRDALFARLAAAVAPGGTLVLVGHHPGDPQHAARADAYLAPEEIAALLDADRWEILAAEARTRPVPGHRGEHGHGGMLTDAVLHARRRI
ncbi:class I SAM-dependent methyltransferase [Streptomonospora litoralis]|uniref:Mg-protoporphyrin IX methyl transferase n=1 Tax=Streptomonospora litoralis TaxID=2498135 RepID=A0A4V0ZJR1_9ACTN|nr:class I SAM-dependent methyltransferase [Streptomonospora litoralis]QBI54362.1 Mg-protoporphyrin IX methyl transferase [Streptomonospora litoralis]